MTLNVKNFHAYVGSETGYLKGVNVGKKKFENINRTTSTINREHEITDLIWTDEDQTQIHCAHRNQTVKTFDAFTGSLQRSFDATAGTGPLRGLEILGDSLVTCSQSGAFRVWKDDKPFELYVGADIYRMRKSPFSNLFATGGKENDLKIWDLTSPEKPLFAAKNVRNDFLSLRVPVWVTDHRFMDDNTVLVATGYHKIRLYDIRERQRRPKLATDFDDYPITSMSIAPSRERSVLVGNTHGRVALIDMRMLRMVHIFKGFAGSVRSVQAHPTKSYVFSVSLDRCLRVHDFDKHTLLSKVYLKSRLTSLLIRTASTRNIVEASDDEEMVEDMADEEEGQTQSGAESEDDEEDAIWDEIEASDMEADSDADGSEVPTSENKPTNITEGPNKKRKRSLPKETQEVSPKRRTRKKKAS